MLVKYMSFRTELRRDYKAHAERLIELDTDISKAKTAGKDVTQMEKERADHAHQLVHLADLMETCD